MTADADDMLTRLTQKLEPSQIRSTLMFSALLQLVHELIKQSVLTDVKRFFGYSDIFGEGDWLYGEEGKAHYEESVLALAPGKAFDASARWLERAGAITAAQRERLDEIYAHRHQLTHGIAGFIVDVEQEPDISILTDALQIARDIDRFWIGVEKDMGTYDEHGDVDVDQVLSGRTIVLQLCVNAYLGVEYGEESTAEGATGEKE
jgi:hypothetical protein